MVRLVSDAAGEPAPASFETPTSWALCSRPLPLRSLREPLRSQWNLGLPSAQDEGFETLASQGRGRARPVGAVSGMLESPRRKTSLEARTRPKAAGNPVQLSTE